MNFNNFLTLTAGFRAFSELYEINKLTKWNSKDVDKSKLAFYAFGAAITVVAIADFVLFSCRYHGRAVSPYVEWGMLVPRISLLIATRAFERNTDLLRFRDEAVQISKEQLLTVARKIVPSAVSILSPTVGKYCDITITGLEMIARALYILPNTKKRKI